MGKSKDSANLSIFATNIHMASHTLIFNGVFIALQAMLSEGPLPSLQVPGGFEAIALGNEALNGILIGLLMRRFDSTAKNYAFSASIFATAALSAVFLDHRPAWEFYAGALPTFVSMVLYTSKAAAPAAGNKEKDK